MALVDTLKRMFTADERIVYRCDACGETFDVGASVESPTCTAYESAEIRQINRV